MREKKEREESLREECRQNQLRDKAQEREWWGRMKVRRIQAGIDRVGRFEVLRVESVGDPIWARV